MTHVPTMPDLLRETRSRTSASPVEIAMSKMGP